MTARRRAPAVSRSELLAALLDLDDVFELGELVPERAPCGRPRIFPGYMYVLYGALISVFKSSRQTETELGSEQVWSFICEKVRSRFASDPAMWLPPGRPMKRHHYSYMRNRHLVDEGVLGEMLAGFRTAAAEDAKRLGMCDPGGDGSLTHPSLDRVVYADGKVVKPLYKAKAGTVRVDRQTGEIRTLRSDPDADLHITGSGEMAFGSKFVLASCRRPEPHSRVILDVASVPDKGGEAAKALESLHHVAPLLPGAQGVLYDGAFRGVHMQEVLSQLGLLPIVPVTAKAGGKRQRKPREERVVLIEAQVVRTPAGQETVQLYAQVGAIGIGELNEEGEVVFCRLERVAVKRRLNRGNGRYRFYVEYRLPADKGGGNVLVRIDTTPEDTARKLNRSEYVRGIPVDDPDYARLYPRRSDAESINRALDDSLWLRRAHSKGRLRQLFELMGFALMTNALAVYRHGRCALSRAG